MNEHESSRHPAVSGIREELGRGQNARAEAVLRLVERDDPQIDLTLFEALAEPDLPVDVERLICRILAEREPDRDPAFLLGRVYNASHLPFSGKTKQGSENALSNPFPGANLYGFSRLRQADPVGVYARQLDHRWASIRMSAAFGLGDTADLAALEPLAKALNDASWRVRVNAADSVRRLRHAGAATQLPTHRARARLVTCLTDRRRAVRVAAARALGSMGDIQPLHTLRDRSPWWAWRRVRDVKEVLAGKIPPLSKIWPGDETT